MLHCVVNDESWKRKCLPSRSQMKDPLLKPYLCWFLRFPNWLKFQDFDSGVREHLALFLFGENATEGGQKPIPHALPRSIGWLGLKGYLEIWQRWDPIEDKSTRIEKRETEWLSEFCVNNKPVDRWKKNQGIFFLGKGTPAMVQVGNHQETERYPQPGLKWLLFLWRLAMNHRTIDQTGELASFKRKKGAWLVDFFAMRQTFFFKTWKISSSIMSFCNFSYLSLMVLWVEVTFMVLQKESFNERYFLTASLGGSRLRCPKILRLWCFIISLPEKDEAQALSLFHTPPDCLMLMKSS